ncbi:MAG: SOS response-associated peptidase family protein [Bdellovibrionales bacterium]
MNRSLATTSATDNLAPQDSVYPDQDAPIIRNGLGEDLELILARWGFPPIPGQTAPITNIRNLQSKWWKDVNREFITDKKYRCLVPFSAFAEPVRDSIWFVTPNAEVACFAGIWRPWEGERLAEQPGQKRRSREKRNWMLYSFLTTDANDIVRPVHEKAMPSILVSTEDQIEWLNGGIDSLRLQRPLPNEQLQVRH